MKPEEIFICMKEYGNAWISIIYIIDFIRE
ncbi:Uncharacterised protein [Escherichia coli]|nr:hypothetical protein BvCmsKSP014_05233 [Escherichia coli]STF23983.1 Uncharacterised protein [Escherichia coli]STI73896.1 Uncharacterised protein [Escherichia coli]STQ24741.1 Uncharacterised protein [Escherichia coli]